MSNTSGSSSRGTRARGGSQTLVWLLIGGAIGFATLMVVYSLLKDSPLTEAELILFQVIIFMFGLTGSYLFGRYSAAEGAREVIRPHAVSAFRRVVSLYEALRRFTVTIEERRARLLERAEEENTTSVDLAWVDATLELFVVQITEQIGTANDAAEDWRDIVPDEVARVENELRGRRRGQA